MSKLFLLVILVSSQIQFTKSLQALPALAVTNVTVNGVSSGAAFATQMHISFSSSIIGSATTAGVPYYCAMNSLTLAMSTCITGVGTIPVGTLVQGTINGAKLGYVDSVKNLVDARIYILAGAYDSVIVPSTSISSQQYFVDIGTKAENIKTVFNIPAEHGWIVNSTITTTPFGPCDQVNKPYFLNNCNYNSAFEASSWLYNENFVKHIESNPVKGTLIQFDQTDFCGRNCDKMAFADTGYVYVPDICKYDINNNQNCKLMVIFMAVRWLLN